MKDHESSFEHALRHAMGTAGILIPVSMRQVEMFEIRFAEEISKVSVPDNAMEILERAYRRPARVIHLEHATEENREQEFKNLAARNAKEISEEMIRELREQRKKHEP